MARSAWLREQLRRNELDALDALTEIHLHARDYVFARQVSELQQEMDHLYRNRLQVADAGGAFSGQRLNHPNSARSALFWQQLGKT